jgi:hypothetical protein
MAPLTLLASSLSSQVIVAASCSAVATDGTVVCMIGPRTRAACSDLKVVQAGKLGGELLQAVGRDVGDHRAGAFPGQAQRGRAPDAGAGAGHDGGPAGEAAGGERRLGDALGVVPGGNLAGAGHGGTLHNPDASWRRHCSTNTEGNRAGLGLSSRADRPRNGFPSVTLP